jgi:hypothetical protein
MTMLSGSRNLCETLAGFNGEGLKELNIPAPNQTAFSLYWTLGAFDPQPCERGLGIGRFLIAD